MKHLLVDTNIFVYITLLTSKGEDRKVFESLKNALDNDKVKLLLPEVVALEYSRKISEEYEAIGKNIGKLKTYIEEEMQKDGISLGGRVVKEIGDALNNILKERKTRSKEVKEKVIGLFEHRNTINIPITEGLLLKTLKYSLRGRKPLDSRVKTYLQPDVLLVLAASSYIKDNKIEHLIICSNDLAAFSKTEKVDSATYEPNEDIAALFPNLDKCYRFLTDLLNKELESAIDKEKLTISESYLAEIMEREALQRRMLEDYVAAMEKNRKAVVESAICPIQEHARVQQEHMQKLADWLGLSHGTKDNTESEKK